MSDDFDMTTIYRTVVVAVAAIIVVSIAAFVVVVVATDDPKSAYEFFGGPFLNVLNVIFGGVVLVIGAVLSRKVTEVGRKVARVEANTNGTTTRLISHVEELTRQLDQTQPTTEGNPDESGNSH